MCELCVRRIPTPTLLARTIRFLFCLILGFNLHTVADETNSTYIPGNPEVKPRLGLGFSGELPRFDLQLPDSRSEVTGDMIARLGVSWMRDIVAGTDDAPTATPVPPPLPGFLACLPGVDTAWFYGRVGFTPIGTLAGGIYGTFAGVSEHKINQAYPALESALTELQLAEQFEPLFLALAHQKLPGVLILTNQLPLETIFPPPSLLESVAPLPPELVAVRQARSDITSFGGTDVVVLLRMVNWGLSGQSQHNAVLSVTFLLKGTLINARTRTRGRSFYAKYESAPAPFFAWATNSGQPFRAELWRGMESLANQIAQQMPAPPPASTVVAGGDL